MKSYCLGLFILCMSFLSMSDTVQARAFRCDSYVIDVGMHKAEVMKKCGLPALRDQRIERRRQSVTQSQGKLVVRPLPVQITQNVVQSEREIEIQIEEWVYNFGAQRFMQMLIFEDGRLKQIQDLGYGQ
jgi:hypothetical protein